MSQNSASYNILATIRGTAHECLRENATIIFKRPKCIALRGDRRANFLFAVSRLVFRMKISLCLKPAHTRRQATLLG